MAKKNAMHEAEKRTYQAEAGMKFAIARLGDKLAKKHHYRNLHGMEAIVRYLVDKYHWTPAQVRAFTVEDLTLLLDEFD